MSSEDRQLQTSRAILHGCHGWVAGERYILSDGQTVIIGRSRSCDISLRRIPRYSQMDAVERDNDHDFNTVSRRHIRLTLKRGLVHLEDLSTNGTFFNNIQANGPVDLDLREGPVQIRLGTRETFSLALEGQPASNLGESGTGLFPDTYAGEGSANPPLERNEHDN